MVIKQLIEWFFETTYPDNGSLSNRSNGFRQPIQWSIIYATFTTAIIVIYSSRFKSFDSNKTMHAWLLRYLRDRRKQ